MEWSSPEIQRLSLAIGSLLALAWKDRLGILPGGIIVPGFLTNLLLLSPWWGFLVLGIGYLSQWIYQHWLERLEHQRRLPMYILGVLSLGISTPCAFAVIQLGLLPASIDSISGSLLPGVIAFNLHRQGWRPVTQGMLLTTAATLGLTLAVVVVGITLFRADFNFLQRYYVHSGNIHIQVKAVQFLITLILGMMIYQRTQIRPGGYVVAPIAAALLLHPLSAVMFVIGCISVDWMIQVISQRSLMIGLNRYVVSLLLSTGYVWTMELLLIQAGVQALPFQANHILVIIAILSYANDLTLHRRKQILPWMLILIASAAVVLWLTHQLLALAS
jgi:hypothetical protein